MNWNVRFDLSNRRYPGWPTPKPGKVVTLGAAAGFVFSASISRAASIFQIPEPFWQAVFFEAHGDGMVGYNFQVKREVSINQIGWLDQGGDGLSRSFQVGLWKMPSMYPTPSDPVQELLSITGNGVLIPGGTTAALVDGKWRVVDLAAPLILQPGSYQIAGLDTASTTDSIRYIWQPANEFSNDDVDLGSFFYATMVTPQQPGFHFSTDFYLASGFELGPMLFTVPEASGSMFTVAGFGLLLFNRRRRSTDSAVASSPGS
jgi:hypothetical protein